MSLVVGWDQVIGHFSVKCVMLLAEVIKTKGHLNQNFIFPGSSQNLLFSFFSGQLTCTCTFSFCCGLVLLL